MPTAPNRSMDSTTFTTTADTWVAALGPVTDAMNTLGGEIDADATTASAAAAAALASQAAAAGSASAAAASSNATVWVSGTTYAFGANVISPITALTYRRIVAGAGTTDPSLDTTNWRALTFSISSVTSVTDNYSMVNGGPNYIATAMTAIGKSVTLVNATLLSTGGPQVMIDNTKGAYSVGIRDNTGVLIGAVGPGGEAYISLKTKTTSAGVWSITGSGLEPGLATLSSVLSSFVMTASHPHVYVALDDNVSIHFAYWSANSFYAYVVDNVGKVVTTPITVTASGGQPVAAFKISSTQAIVFYGINGVDQSAIVITLNGSSPSYTLSLGTALNTTTNMGSDAWGGEKPRNDPRIAQLTSTLYVVGYRNNSAEGRAQVISVSGTTLTLGTASANMKTNTQAVTIYPLTATTALAITKSGTSTPFAVEANILTVSGTTIAVGTSYSSGVSSSNANACSSVLLSPTTFAVMDNNTTSTTNIAAGSISGTVITFGALVTMAQSVSAGSSYSSEDATRRNPHMWAISSTSFGAWLKVASASYGIGKSILKVFSVSGSTLTAGNELSGSLFSSQTDVNNLAGAGVILPQGSTEVVGIKTTSPSYDTSVGVGLFATTSKISGTTLSSGVGVPIPEVMQQAPKHFMLGKTSNGDYLVIPIGRNSGTSDIGAAGVSKMVILRSNGDRVQHRGSISIPEIWMSTSVSITQTPLQIVSPNRVVLTGGGFGSTTNLTDPILVINVEIAA